MEETAYNEVLCHSQVTSTCATSAFTWSAAVKFCTAVAQISTNVSTAQKLHNFIHLFHMHKHDQQKGTGTQLSQHIHLHPLLQHLNSTSLLSSRFHNSGNSGISNSSMCEGSHWQQILVFNKLVPYRCAQKYQSSKSSSQR